MKTLTTAHFGTIRLDEESTLEFPEGLPGFEDHRAFAAIQHPANEAVVFLQAIDRPEVCFVAVPVRVWRSDYELEISPEDLATLGRPADSRPEIGTDVIALAIVSLVEGEPPTANLLSPVVIDRKTRRAVQAIRPDGRYTCREPLAAGELVCS